MTRRIRRRYLALKVESDRPFEDADIRQAVWSAVQRLFGEYGASQTGLFLVEYDKLRNLAVLRCSHTALPMVRASIASVTEIQNHTVAIHVLRVSGTLKALRKKLSQ